MLSFWSEDIQRSFAGDQHDDTALHLAIKEGDVNAVNLLVEYSDLEEDLRAELIAFIPQELEGTKRENILKLLAVTNPEEDKNFARFIAAVKQQNPGAAKNYVKNGVDRTKLWEGKTALQMAVESRNSAMVSSLLTYLNDLPAEAGARACEENIGDTSEGSDGYEILNGQTQAGAPLHIAILLDQSTPEAFANVKDIIQELMLKKADINLKRKSDGATPLFLAAETGTV